MSDGPPPPRANPDLEGHAEAEQTLRAALGSGRLHHAWLITGPEGIGKATLAFRFARFILAGGAAEPAGSDLFGPPAAAPANGLGIEPNHPVFRQIASGGHPDLVTVERTMSDDGEKRQTEIVVDDVRRMGEFLRLTPAMGSHRVAVIDAADDLNRNAASALLKTLEEPTPGAVILLVAQRPGRLLATVRSRCRMLPLKALAEANVRTLLGRYCPDLGPDDATEIARLADGSIGRAVAYAQAGGLELGRELFALLAGLPALPISRLHAFADRVQRNEAAFRIVIELLAGWLARLVLATAGAAPPPTPSVAATDPRPWLAARDQVERLAGLNDWANLDRKQVMMGAMFAVEKAARG